MKRYTYLVALVILVVSLSACNSQKWFAVDTNVNTEQLLQEKFPKLYAEANAGEIVIDKIEQQLDKNGAIAEANAGEIVIDKIEQQLDKNGAMKYHVTYSHTGDGDDFDLLWQTIFMPMLLDD